jgi:murein DD-endopeptidase MepM/ murein hydrolase activator NlpD
MSIKYQEFHPIMGETLNDSNTILMDMSEKNPDLKKIDLLDTIVFEEYINKLLKQSSKRFGIGGYLEQRNIYQRSTVFKENSDSKFRNIHLGIDIWSYTNSQVYCPFDGVVHSFQDNKGFGNYGPTIILEHFWQGETIYSLYGHLSTKDLKSLSVGQPILKGENIGHLGSSIENGNWPPHLHFQMIRNLENKQGDYPGVCSSSEKEKYKENCPNPASWLGIPANVIY